MRAPRFSIGTLSSISFATVTPSLVMGGTELPVEDDVAAPGAGVTFTASASAHHATPDSAACVLTIDDLLRHCFELS